MHLLCYLCTAKENFAAFFFFTPRSIKLWSTETQENSISSNAESQLPNPSKVKKDITGKVCYQATGVDFITSALLLGHWRPAATSVFRANQPCFVSGWWSKIAVAFLPFDPPGIAQDRPGNHESVCLSVCKSQEAAPAKSPKSSECSKTRCQNNAKPSLPPSGPLSGIITCLSQSLGLQQVQAEGPLHPARGEGRQHHPAHAVPSEGDSVSSLCLFSVRMCQYSNIRARERETTVTAQTHTRERGHSFLVCNPLVQ